MKKTLSKVFVAISIFIITILVQNVSKAEEITSNYYNVDNDKNIISRIEPETTVEMFKARFGDVKIYKNKELNNELTTGFVGTGMYLEYEEKVYELSVVGDFDGDGKATQVELTNTIRYIVGLSGATLEGTQYISADLTGDGKVDQRDITKFIRYIVYGELDLGKQDTTAPDINLSLVKKTSCEIRVNAQAIDKESGMGENPEFVFYVKKSSQNDSEYREVQKGTNATLDLEKLEQNTCYDIKVVTQDKTGNKAEKEITVKTDKIPDGTEQGAIKFGETTWENNMASTTIETDTEYKIEYQVNGINGNWTKADVKGAQIIVPNLNHNDIVYARLTDGTSSGNYSSVTIIDAVKPNLGISLSAEKQTITATATADDNESGITNSATYTFYMKETGENDTAYVQKQSGTSNILTVPNLTVGKNYTIKVEVNDIAGNTGIQEKSILIPDDISPIVDFTVLNKTSNTATVKATATDEGGLPNPTIYIFYIKETGAEDSTYVEVQNSSNDTCTLPNLVQGKDYTVKVTVADNAENIGVKERSILTDTIPSGTQPGAINFVNLTWTNGKANVEITTNSTYYIEYQINSTTGTWTKATTEGTAVTLNNLNHNDIVYARLTDGSSSGGYICLTIADTIAPEEFNINVTDIKTNGFKISGSTTDKQSGLKNYTYVVEKGGVIVSEIKNTKAKTTTGSNNRQ